MNKDMEKIAYKINNQDMEQIASDSLTVNLFAVFCPFVSFFLLTYQLSDAISQISPSYLILPPGPITTPPYKDVHLPGI